jgi:hypothetical protein
MKRHGDERHSDVRRSVRRRVPRRLWRLSSDSGDPNTGPARRAVESHGGNPPRARRDVADRHGGADRPSRRRRSKARSTTTRAIHVVLTTTSSATSRRACRPTAFRDRWRHPPLHRRAHRRPAGPGAARRGFDVLSCQGAGRANQRILDEDQLAYATAQRRPILTFNVVDFTALDAEWKRDGRRQAGIIVSAEIRSLTELV